MKRRRGLIGRLAARLHDALDVPAVPISPSSTSLERAQAAVDAWAQSGTGPGKLTEYIARAIDDAVKEERR